MRLTLRHKIETNVSGFWKLYFDADLTRTLMDEVCTYEVLEETTAADGLMHRRVQYRFNLGLPAMAKKILGDGSYTEIGQFDPVSMIYRAQTVPMVGADKFQSSFQLHAEAQGDHCCERVFVAETQVKVFGIGPLIEGLIEKSMRDGQTQGVERVNRWLRERGASERSPVAS